MPNPAPEKGTAIPNPAPAPEAGPTPHTAPPAETALAHAKLMEQMLQDDANREAAWDYYRQLHPSDQVEVLANLPKALRLSMVQEMSPETIAALLEHLEPRTSAQMLRNYQPDDLAEVLDLADPTAAAGILEQLPEEKRQETINEMAAPAPVETLLSYPDGTAGRLIDPAIPVFHESTPVPIALDRLRLMGAAAEQVTSLPVVNDAGMLIGSLHPIRLALARPNSNVGDIMDPSPASVSAAADEAVAAQLIGRLKVGALPVVEEDGRLAGIIRAEDAVAVVEEQATENMFRVAGLGEERITGPLNQSIRSRFPWLALNLLTVFAAAAVIGAFESTLAQAVALAAFLPIVAGQGGIAGTQTVTLVVRSLAKGELPRGFALRLLRREITLALIHGIALGILVGAVAWVWHGKPVLALVLAIAMTGNMAVAAIAGAGIPLALRRLGMDPAVSAAVFVTTFTDVIGFLLFLGQAALLIEYLA